MPPSFLRRAVNEEANSASRDQCEIFPLKIWFARRDIDLRSRYIDLRSRYIDLRSRYIDLRSRYIDLRSQYIELRSRYLESFASMLTRSWKWPGRSPSKLPLLLPAKNLLATRTDSGVTHNGEHWSGKGTILVSTGAGGSLDHSTAMFSSVGSATESVEVTSRSVAEMSPSISFALTEAQRRHC